jgi:hypothetical protein
MSWSGRDPTPGQEQGVTKDGDDHSPRPHASGPTTGWVGSEGDRAEDPEDGAEDGKERVLERVAVGGDEARPGLVVGVGIGLGIEAREEGQRLLEGQTQQADSHPPGVGCGHVSSSLQHLCAKGPFP